MQGLSYRSRLWWGVAAVVLSACAVVPPSTETPIPALPFTPAETASKADFYTVKPGDTLIRIALDSGQSPSDVARWNGLMDPGKIGVGQVLRLVPPAPGDTPLVVRPTSAIAPTPQLSDEDLTWAWPYQGPVLADFSQSKKKGIEIGGTAGEAVLAAADGKVLYAGAGLRGYGNLVILKHNNTYVSMYAHNQAVLVKEDDTVRRGQKIAEMGSSEADRTKLHFEVRKLGNPVDPAKYLPPK